MSGLGARRFGRGMMGLLTVGALGCADLADLPAPEAPTDLAVEESRTTNTVVTREALQRWSLHLRANWDGVQPNCRPTRMSPPARVPPRGAIMLFHGYTACPQQFYEWGRLLAEQGYEVFLPLSPGHGRVRTGSMDDTRALPGLSPEPYARFVDEMNSLMAQVRVPTGGARVVGGLSVGGALASMAVQRQPSLYDRAFIAAPFYESGTFWINAARAASEQLRRGELRALTESAWREAGELPLGWGEGCEVERRGGRAGICQFQVKHLASVVRFGASALDQVRPQRTRIQFVGVEADQAAGNGAILRAARAYGVGAGLCFYRSPASHSLFSRFDNPTEDKFWLPSLLESATRFVTAGQPFAIDGASLEPGAPRCRIAPR
jgi:pimeloyl-ACP methyl ester carboxylesterase